MPEQAAGASSAQYALHKACSRRAHRGERVRPTWTRIQSQKVYPFASMAALANKFSYRDEDPQAALIHYIGDGQKLDRVAQLGISEPWLRDHVNFTGCPVLADSYAPTMTAIDRLFSSRVTRSSSSPASAARKFWYW